MRTRPLSNVNRSGIALVAVLAVLVVLALMAAAFTIVVHQNMSMSKLQSESLKLDMLLRDGLAHAQSAITVADVAPNKDKKTADPLTASQLFNGNAFAPGIDEEKKFGPWMYVNDENGNAYGRYRVRIEDEAAKVNLNKAHMLSQSKGSGWDTGEIDLPHSLGVSKKAGESIVGFKYGNDMLPGGRGDDDHNNPKLMADGLDNNADGTLDEADEGVNDPGEYTSQHPRGDDRSFSSFREAMPFIMNISSMQKMSEATRQTISKEIARRATLYSVDLPGSPTLPTDEPSDINSITAKECRRRLLTANEKILFEASSKKRNQIAANIIDYRDENHVLTTLGGQTYGVEAICFNEVMANEASSAIWARQGFAYPAVMGIGADGAIVWKQVYGSVDGERLIYSPSLFYTDSLTYDYWWSVVGVKKLWNIFDDGKKNYGKIAISGNTITFELPPGPGKYGSATRPTFEGGGWVGGDDASIKEYYIDTLKLMNTRGKTVNGHIKFPDNFFKNQLVDFHQWGGSLLGRLKVKSSTSGHRFVATGSDATKIMNGIKSAGVTNVSVAFHAWELGLTTELPEVSIYQLLRSRTGNPGEYFQVQITRDPSGPKNSYKANTLNVSGDPASGNYTLEDEKTWYYNNGKPMRTDSQGFLDVFYTSSPKVNPNAKIVQAIGFLRMIAPETIEMYNASSTPISLANWRVICNTGSLASEIGRIQKTAYYDTVLKRPIIDDNPIVRPRGHFYLVNDTKLFDARYGNADFSWGTTADEQIPVFEMDKKHWGVAFKIKKVDWNTGFAEGKIYIDGTEDFDEDLFQGEVFKFLYPGQENDPESWNGALVPANWWKNDKGKYLRMWTEYRGAGVAPKENGRIMVLGLPARGGIVSLTLKNEYDQVCARTVEYGSVEEDELGYSTEKEDPTHYTWVKRKKPTIGGTEKEALNRAMRGKNTRPVWIKNGPYGSVAELARIRTADDFENIGTTGGKSTGERKVSSLADVFCTSQVRLESCGEDVEKKGWGEALYEVDAYDLRTITANNADWEVDQWKGHTLRFLTGPLRGQKFPVYSNSRNSLMLSEAESKSIPRSAPGRMTIRNCTGAKFTVGPGYQTPLCYARQSNQEGEWLWHKAIPVPGTYDLYLYGLNDSVKTTEFLEENLNASIDVALWNYITEQWDTICTRKKYGKEDCFNAGKITPDHTSPDGDLKMKLTAHDVSETGLDAQKEEGGIVSEYQSGYAWFNYAVVTPLPVVGRVNVNTAPARLLESLPGISPKLAGYIENGTDAQGVDWLKPYTKLSDLFEVRDFTVDVFRRCANLLAVNSYAYTVEVEAETLKESTDAVNAFRSKRYVMELNPIPGSLSKVRQVEKY